MKSLLHGVQGHGGVKVPRRGNDHQVRDFGIAGLAPSFSGGIVDAPGSGRLKGSDFLSSALDIRGLNIAQDGDFGMPLRDQPFQHLDEGASPVSKPKHGNTHLGNRRGSVRGHGSGHFGPRIHARLCLGGVGGTGRESQAQTAQHAAAKKAADLQKVTALHAREGTSRKAVFPASLHLQWGCSYIHGPRWAWTWAMARSRSSRATSVGKNLKWATPVDV